MFGAAHHRKAAHPRKAAWRGAFAALAFLAILMKVATPPGFMIASAGSGPGFPLVICTGSGPLTVDTPHQKGDHNKSKSDAPCAFAGHAAPPTPATGPLLLGSAIVQTAEPAALAVDLTPGRGLAAPPPPSRGPPSFL